MKNLNLEDGAITVYEALQNIKNKKYVIPSFQRQFVWNMEQIERLWDSILQGYPIATFLFWNNDETNITDDTYFCTFQNKLYFDFKRGANAKNYETSKYKECCISVLDGQQRLSSLFVSLMGECFIHLKMSRKNNGVVNQTKLIIQLEEDRVLKDDNFYEKTYGIKFSKNIRGSDPTEFDIKTIFTNSFQNKSTREVEIEKTIVAVSEKSKNYAKKILNTLCVKIFDEPIIQYTQLNDMKLDDALEMFVRFNSAGKPLTKPQISMSILEVYWPSAKTEIGKLLVGAYSEFGTDFIIRLAFYLFDENLKGIINSTNAKNLKDNIESIKDSLIKLEVLLAEKNIDVARFSSTWNILLPIIYSIFYNPNYLENRDEFFIYIYRAIFFRYYQIGTLGKLKILKNKINDNDEYEITLDMLDSIPDLEITDGKIEDLLNLETGGHITEEVLSYLAKDWLDLTCTYEIDHLHPQSYFNRKFESINSETLTEWKLLKDRLPNLHLLVGSENASKSDMSLDDYFLEMTTDQQEKFQKQAMLPEGIDLQFSNFKTFYEERKKILKNRIISLLE